MTGPINIPLPILKPLVSTRWRSSDGDVTKFAQYLEGHADGDAISGGTCVYIMHKGVRCLDESLSFDEARAIARHIPEPFSDVGTDHVAINQHYLHSLEQFYAHVQREWDAHVSRTDDLIGTAAGRIFKELKST